MGAVLVPVVIVLLAIGLVMVKRLGREGDQRRDEVMTASHTLRYDVPAGQDPAGVLVALSRQGFEAVADPDDVHALVIMCPLGSAQREEVRVVLENEASEVRFVDERWCPESKVRQRSEVRALCARSAHGLSDSGHQ